MLNTSMIEAGYIFKGGLAGKNYRFVESVAADGTVTYQVPVNMAERRWMDGGTTHVSAFAAWADGRLRDRSLVPLGFAVAAGTAAEAQQRASASNASSSSSSSSDWGVEDVLEGAADIAGGALELVGGIFEGLGS